MIQQTQKSFPGLLATGTFEKQPPARIRFLRFTYASCICSNFNWLLSLRKRRRKRKKIRRKGKKERDWGERVRDARYNNPPLFTSADAGVRKFLIGSLPFSLSCFPPRPPPFFAPATQATDSLVCLHHLWLARVRVLVYARSFMERMPYTCLAIVSCLWRVCVCFRSTNILEAKNPHFSSRCSGWVLFSFFVGRRNLLG